MLGAVNSTWEMAQKIAREKGSAFGETGKRGFIALQSLLAFFQANLNFVMFWSRSCPSPKDSDIQFSPLKSHCTFIYGEIAEGNFY